MVSNSRKKAPNESILFPENKFSPAGMKDSLKNMFSRDVKVNFGGSNVWKKLERMVFTGQKLSWKPIVKERTYFN